MGWLKKAKKKKEGEEKLLEMTKQRLEELDKSGLLNLIEEVKSEIEKETNYRYELNPTRYYGEDERRDYNHFGRITDARYARFEQYSVHIKYNYFRISVEPDGIYLTIEPSIFLISNPIKIDPSNIIKKEIYKWFKRISEHTL